MGLVEDDRVGGGAVVGIVGGIELHHVVVGAVEAFFQGGAFRLEFGVDPVALDGDRFGLSGVEGDDGVEEVAEGIEVVVFPFGQLEMHHPHHELAAVAASVLDGVGEVAQVHVDVDDLAFGLLDGDDLFDGLAGGGVFDLKHHFLEQGTLGHAGGVDAAAVADDRFGAVGGDAAGVAGGGSDDRRAVHDVVEGTDAELVGQYAPVTAVFDLDPVGTASPVVGLEDGELLFGVGELPGVHAANLRSGAAAGMRSRYRGVRDGGQVDDFADAAVGLFVGHDDFKLRRFVKTRPVLTGKGAVIPFVDAVDGGDGRSRFAESAFSHHLVGADLQTVFADAGTLVDGIDVPGHRSSVVEDFELLDAEEEPGVLRYRLGEPRRFGRFRRKRHALGECRGHGGMGQRRGKERRNQGSKEQRHDTILGMGYYQSITIFV